MRPKCQHCLTRLALTRRASRGLCSRCYTTPDIRKLYPLEYEPEWDEPTEEELEAQIAERRANLPDWWDRSFSHDD